MSDSVLVHVIVPAHDEAAVISRCLASLLAAPCPVPLRVTVVADGCADATCDVVRAVAERDERVRLVELVPGRGKPSAIRAGAAALPADPREVLTAVVDADVEVRGAALEGLVRTLAGRTEPTVCAPRLVVDTSACSSLVCRWYRAWHQEPYILAGVVGAGVYAVNAAGLPAVRELPDVLGDDAWVRAWFPPSARFVCDGEFVVRPARHVRALVRRRARVLAGNAELRSFADRPRHEDAGFAPPRGAVAPLDRAVFVAVERAARLLAAWRRLRGRGRTWGTDTSSRVPDVPRVPGAPA